MRVLCQMIFVVMFILTIFLTSLTLKLNIFYAFLVF